MTRPGTPGWRWRNVPVPEAHLGGLLVGAVVEFARPWSLPAPRPLTLVLGGGLLLAGLGVVAWSVRAVGRQSIEDPTGLVTGGPYRHSRNPMYVAWTALYVGVALLAETAWPLVLLPAVAVLTHRQVRREERALAKRFDGDYAAYRERVRRYL